MVSYEGFDKIHIFKDNERHVFLNVREGSYKLERREKTRKKPLWIRIGDTGVNLTFIYIYVCTYIYTQHNKW